MKQKTYTAPLQIKADGNPGEFMAEFATLNVIDHDGDVTVPGAFEDGQGVIIEPWNHGWTLPVGKGVIHADDNKAWVDGKFFIETSGGNEHYQTVKAMGDLAEWSYTFYVLEGGPGDFEGKLVNYLRKMDVTGVSPVTRGAGIDTRTVAIKSEKPDESENGSDQNEGEGDANPTVKPSGADADLLLRMAIAEISLITTLSEV